MRDLDQQLAMAAAAAVRARQQLMQMALQV
jgi:hypothetical protein